MAAPGGCAVVIGGGVGSCFEAVWLAIPLRVAFALFALRQLWLLVRWRRAQLRKALKEPRWGGGRGVAAQRMRGVARGGCSGLGTGGRSVLTWQATLCSLAGASVAAAAMLRPPGSDPSDDGGTAAMLRPYQVGSAAAALVAWGMAARLSAKDVPSPWAGALRARRARATARRLRRRRRRLAGPGGVAQGGAGVAYVFPLPLVAFCACSLALAAVELHAAAMALPGADGAAAAAACAVRALALVATAAATLGAVTGMGAHTFRLRRILPCARGCRRGVGSSAAATIGVGDSQSLNSRGERSSSSQGGRGGGPWRQLSDDLNESPGEYLDYRPGSLERGRCDFRAGSDMSSRLGSLDASIGRGHSRGGASEEELMASVMFGASAMGGGALGQDVRVGSEAAMHLPLMDVGGGGGGGGGGGDGGLSCSSTSDEEDGTEAVAGATEAVLGGGLGEEQGADGGALGDGDGGGGGGGGGGARRSEEERSGLLSALTFWWALPMLTGGCRAGQLAPENMVRLPVADEALRSTALFRVGWRRQRRSSAGAAGAAGSPWDLPFALLRVFGAPFWRAGALLLLGNVFSLAQPLLLHELLLFVDGKPLALPRVCPWLLPAALRGGEAAGYGWTLATY